jgi:hypothetical protein
VREQNVYVGEALAHDGEPRGEEQANHVGLLICARDRRGVQLKVGGVVLVARLTGGGARLAGRRAEPQRARVQLVAGAAAGGGGDLVVEGNEVGLGHRRLPPGVAVRPEERHNRPEGLADSREQG